MESSGQGELAESFSMLERLAQLKEKDLLTEDEYAEIRRQLVFKIKAATAAPYGDTTGAAVSPSPQQISYGALHMVIVDKLAKHAVQLDVSSKELVFKYMSEMADAGAIFPGETKLLTPLIDEMYAPAQIPTTVTINSKEGYSALSDVVVSVNNSYNQIMLNKVSPATAAIAGTAQQSTLMAAETHKAHSSKADLSPNNPPVMFASFWKRIAISDLEGAFEGGAAAMEWQHAFHFVPEPLGSLSMSLAAAFGVVVGAGLKSAGARVER
jgi:hypothetical protein